MPEVWTFDKLREVGVFSYLDIPCLKRHDNGFRCCEAGNGHGFDSKEVELMLDEGAVHAVLGLLRTIRIWLLDQNCPCVFA